MSKKIKRQGKINIGNKTHTFDMSFTIHSSHTDYSGYGFHDDKNRKATRRNRKLEEKRAKLYGE
jgi:hypothetical protein